MFQKSSMVLLYQKKTNRNSMTNLQPIVNQMKLTPSHCLIEEIIHAGKLYCVFF